MSGIKENNHNTFHALKNLVVRFSVDLLLYSPLTFTLRIALHSRPGCSASLALAIQPDVLLHTGGQGGGEQVEQEEQERGKPSWHHGVSETMLCVVSNPQQIQL